MPSSGHAAGRLDYNDSILQSRWLNALLIFANNYFGFLYRHVVNAPLMQTKTTTGRWTSQEASEQRRGPIQGARRRRKWLFLAFIVLEAIIYLRFVGLAVYLSRRYPTRPFVSRARPTATTLPESTRLSVPIELANERAHSNPARAHLVNLTNADGEAAECRQKLEGFYTQSYGEFYIWNASAHMMGYERPLTRALLRYFLVLEQLPAVQMMRKEACFYNYLMSCLIAMSVIFGSWLKSRSPYEVAALVFIYEPALIVLSTRARVSRHVRAVGQSYANFWQAYSLDSDNDLVSCRQQRRRSSIRTSRGAGTIKSFAGYDDTANRCESEQVEQLKVQVGARGESATIDRDNFDAILSQLSAYIPSARTQAWRRALVTFHPIAQFSFTSAIVVSIGYAWLWLVYSMDFGTNASTRSFLAANQSSSSSSSPLLLAGGEACARHAALVEASARLARQSIVNNYGAYLHTSHQHHLVTSYDTQSVLDSLEPVRGPHSNEFAETFFCFCLTITIIILYMMLLLITILDLCFWLAELSFKLTVCTCLLQHTSGTHRTPDKAGGHGISCRLSRPTLRCCGHIAQLTTMSARSEAAGGSAVCNIATRLTRDFLLANRTEKVRISESCARALAALEEREATRGRKVYNPHAITDKFLVSTYLDFRLFLDQIDNCRPLMKFIMAFVVFHSLNIIVSTLWVGDFAIKLGCFIGGLVLANLGLGSGAFFQSQCSKLHAPIHSILALCARGDRMKRHLALLWRNPLLDMNGPKSKFKFGVYSIELNYATLLQFNLTVVSAYILLLDRRQA